MAEVLAAVVVLGIGGAFALFLGWAAMNDERWERSDDRRHESGPHATT